MALNNSLAPNKGKQRMGMMAYMSNEAVRAQINAVVGSHSESFITSIVSAVQTNPQLQECTKQSILSAALLGEGLKLSPSPQLGHFYFVPFKNNKQKDELGNPLVEAQFQLGYKGYLQLAIRSGQYKKINVLPIKEGELVRYDPLEETIEVNLIDDEQTRETTRTIGYYAMFEYLNGFKKSLYWSKQKMLSHADRYSQAFSLSATGGRYPKVSYADFEAGNYPQQDAWKYSSFWYKDFDGMACKTMLRQLISKWGIMSIDLQKAYESDMAVIREDGSRDYVEVAEPETVYEPEVPAVQNVQEPVSEPVPVQQQTMAQMPGSFQQPQPQQMSIEEALFQ